MCRETVHQGGPSNRELLQKLQRLGDQLEMIDSRLQSLESNRPLSTGGTRDGASVTVINRSSHAASVAASSTTPRLGAARGAVSEPHNGDAMVVTPIKPMDEPLAD